MITDFSLLNAVYLISSCRKKGFETLVSKSRGVSIISETRLGNELEFVLSFRDAQCALFFGYDLRSKTL